VSYDVYRSLTSGNQGVTPYRAGLASPSLIDTGLTNGTQYFYKVVARAGVAESAASAEIIGIPVSGVLIAQTISFNSIPSHQAGDVFTLSGSASSGLPVSFTSLTPSIASVSGNTVTTLATGSAVIAANQAGNAQYSAAQQVTQTFTVTAAPAVQPPTGLTGYSCDVGCWAASQGLGIRINWTQSSSPSIATNTIYRGDGLTGAQAVIATIPAGIFYLDKNVVKGQTYHYRITATNSIGVTSVQGNDTALAF
jgi:hypothetical protein